MVDQEFEELEKAALTFKAALLKFKTVFSPETAGIAEFCEKIDDFLFDVDQELQSNE